MKKLIQSLVLLLMVCLVACKGDDPVPVKTLEQKIVGKWNWVKQESYLEPANGSNPDVTEFPAGAFVEFISGSGVDNNVIFNLGNGGANQNRTWTKIDNSTFECYFLASSNEIQQIITADESNLVLLSEYTPPGATQKQIIKQTFTRPYVPAP